MNNWKLLIGLLCVLLAQPIWMGWVSAQTDESDSFNITPAPANNLAFTAPPADAIAGATTIAAQVTVTDQYGNLVSGVPVSLTTTTQLNGATEVSSRAAKS